MARYFIDTSVWLEYFIGSQAVSKFRDIIEKESLETSILTVAEISDKSERENKNFTEAMNFISSRSRISGVSVEDAAEAGKIKNIARKRSKNFSLVDALICARAKFSGAVLITMDTGFEGMDGVVVYK